MARTFTKDPDAVLDYQWDWSAWLAGDTIVEHTIDVPAGLTATPHSHTGTAVTAWIKGGTACQVYPVTCHVKTAGGREDDRTIEITVMER